MHYWKWAMSFLCWLWDALRNEWSRLASDTTSYTKNTIINYPFPTLQENKFIHGELMWYINQNQLSVHHKECWQIISLPSVLQDSGLSSLTLFAILYTRNTLVTSAKPALKYIEVTSQCFITHLKKKPLYLSLTKLGLDENYHLHLPWIP